jgi:curved DNA-binding protein
MKDYYKVLGLEKGASAEDIKKAYRHLSKKYHPDATQGSDDKFKEIQEAYSILSDPQKRKEYDNPKQGFGFNPSGGFSRSADWFDMGYNPGFDDFFEEIFRRHGFDPYAQHRTRKKNGANIKVEVRLDLSELFTGKSLNIPISRREMSESGINEMSRNFKVNIKKGFIPGKPIVLRGEGHAGESGGRPGDIIIVPHVKPHPFFKIGRNGNLYCEISVNYTQALLGDTVYIDHVTEGKVEVNIPAGIKPGKAIKLDNKGYPISENSYGDVIVRIDVEFPKKISKEEKELLHQLYEKSSICKNFP